jgi:hypothetical protein
VSKYGRLVKITAEAIETLVEIAPVMDAFRTVTRALKAEPLIWEYLPRHVVEKLAQAYGIKWPYDTTTRGDGAGEKE